MDRIIPNLYISDATTARNLPPDHDFDEIVTLGYLGHFDYNQPDTSTTGEQFVFPDGPHEYTTFEAAADYVVNALENEKKTLVHCQAGVSRSAGITSVAVSEYLGIPLEEAFERVRNARPRVAPEPEIQSSMRRYTDDSLPLDSRYRGN